MTVRIGMWSGPRNISTAMMRSWENRADTDVVDEPFYACYLDRTGIEHPATAEVIASQPTEEADVIADLMGRDIPVLYVKHMTHHWRREDRLEWASAFHNILLIREPREVVASYVKSREACVAEDIGLLQQAQLFDVLNEPPVIDARDFLTDPEGYQRWVCDWVGIDFDPAMLSWPAGPRDSDGVWAPHWYDAVWASTHFAPPPPREVTLSDELAAVAEESRDAYSTLWQRRVKV